MRPDCACRVDNALRGSGAVHEEETMTAIPATRRPPAAATLPAALGALRANGMRVSSARRLVLEALVAAAEPVTADAIAGGLDGRLPPSDVASVYRNLDTLRALGLVERLRAGAGPGRWVLAGGAGGWTACEGCGRHTRLAPAAAARLRALVHEATGLDASFVRFPLVGRCAGCCAEAAA
jgi:Fur family ferric uptake transcriptional regulator